MFEKICVGIKVGSEAKELDPIQPGSYGLWKSNLGRGYGGRERWDETET